MTDTWGAFVPGPLVERSPRAEGPLSGLTFAVKDLFDIAGLVTGCGNPDWEASHEPAATDAWAVDALLGAGARLRGKTITDEISLGLVGINLHYGTPINPRAPALCPAGPPADRPQPWRAGSSTLRSERIPAAPSACRRASAASSACGPRMGGSR